MTETLSANYKTISAELMQFKKLTNNSIVIENGIIKNVGTPVSLQDLANINYVNNTLNFVSLNNETTINTTSDVVYTGSQLTESFINRDPNGSTRFDSFASVSDILSSLGTYSVGGIFFKIIINNIASSDTNNLIILNYNDLNVIGFSTNIIIYPSSSAIFYCLTKKIDNVSSIDAYYYSTINKSIVNSYTKTNNGISLNYPLRSYQLINNIPVLYNYNLYSSDIPAIPNCLFNILGDFNVQTNGSYDIVSSLPTSSEIMTSLGLYTEILENGQTFNFTIKLTAFINHLPSLYTFTLNAPSDSSIVLDTNSLFYLEFSELNWKYASYSIIYNSGIFTCYCTSFYDTMTQNF